MSSPRSVHQIRSTLRQFLDNEAAGGVVLMVAAVIAVITANSPFADRYFSLLDLYIGPISLQHWINDALMSLFFLLVGLEIKREMLDGQLSSWSRRILPGAAAAGGMLFPALVYLYFNWNDPAALGGWAIPTATDIAFALGVLSLFGNSLPVSLKIFLATLAIVDDLGAVMVIALFYTAELNYLPLAAAGIVIGNLIIFNRMGLTALWPYLSLGGLLLVLVFASGVHPTMAGIMLALTIPLKLAPGTSEAARDTSPLHKLEHYLQKPVAFLVLPLFGFANAGLSFAGISLSVFSDPLTMGVAIGLFFGKLIGVLGTVGALVKLRLANLPTRANWGQMTGVALLCGIGFTMSLFIGLLAFNDPSIQSRVKVGILLGSVASGVIGSIFLAVFRRETVPLDAATSYQQKS
ncbi:Na+/H+ antiporter NhaA [Sinorhizobium fredii]|uniref:Na(+)/H(+) antiporter NhaA n=1 Tax=Rhizobium fredii TaxID=380 RepID=A0A2A6M7A4_RHIFR|nr:Na+/H+ antiporter NhaA [Sinorhizobium fredii]PDT50402.1 Na+/H+ antiporter NhaA [Sinorhizobium fredii]